MKKNLLYVPLVLLGINGLQGNPIGNFFRGQTNCTPELVQSVEGGQTVVIRKKAVQAVKKCVAPYLNKPNGAKQLADRLPQFTEEFANSCSANSQFASTFGNECRIIGNADSIVNDEANGNPAANGRQSPNAKRSGAGRQRPNAKRNNQKANSRQGSANNRNNGNRKNGAAAPRNNRNQNATNRQSMNNPRNNNNSDNGPGANGNGRSNQSQECPPQQMNGYGQMPQYQEQPWVDPYSGMPPQQIPQGGPMGHQQQMPQGPMMPPHGGQMPYGGGGQQQPQQQVMCQQPPQYGY